MAGLFLLLFAAPKTYAFAVFSSVLLHEAGHLTAALLFRGSVREIRLMPTGISISLSRAMSYYEEIATALAGPFMNLLYLAALPLLPSALQNSVQTISLTLFSLNMLPIKTLDGGRILAALLSLFLDETISEKVLSVTTAICLSMLWVLSLYIFFYSGVNFMLLLFCAYLFSFWILKKL